MLKTFLILTALALSACSVQPRTEIPGSTGSTIVPNRQESTARDRCASYRKELIAGLGRKSASDDVGPSIEGLQELLDDIAASPELGELLSCLSGE